MPELTHLLAALPETAHAHWLAAMRQDPTIWQACLSVERYPSLACLPPPEWSPAALALAALGQPPDPQPLHSLRAIDPHLRLRAGRAFERHTQPRSSLTPTIQADLAEAGLLALALRERRRLIGSWDGLRAELSLAALTSWRTPLACLFGMIGDPAALLANLLGDGAHADWNALALHAILSNPLPPPAQANLLQPLLPANPLPLLAQLAALRPTLAGRLAAEALRQAEPTDARQAAQLAALAGQAQTALEHLRHASQQLQLAQADLNAQTARLIRQHGLADPAVSLAHWQQAIELAPHQPAYAAALAHHLLDHGQALEAAQVLHANISHHEHPHTRFALARLAYENGDHERARHLCIQTLHTLEHQAASPSSNQDLTDLATLLLELGRPRLALQAIELALQSNPTDASLLALLAQAYFAAQEPAAGMNAMYLATRLAPHNLSLRRQFAARLESEDRWAEAWPERHAIAASAEDNADPLPDLHALAACALRAGQPQETAAACQHALALNPQDGPLHALYAEALLRLGDLAAAGEHFNTATLLAPALPGPWLALAQAYQQDGLEEKALEILRVAAQSAPQSAEIHRALGEACLAANAPTPALEALRRAARLQPDQRQLVLPLAQALHRLGHLDEARQVIETQGWQHPGPDSRQLSYTYAQILLAQGDLACALPPLRAVVAAAPADASPYLDYACTLLTLRQDIPAAIGSLRHVLEIAPQQSIARAFLAEALVAANDLPAALEAYQQALESDLSRDTLWRGRLAQGLGETALALRQPDTAIAALHEAAQCNPQNPHLHQALARAYQQAGLLQNAAQSLRTAIRLAPQQADLRLALAELHIQHNEFEAAHASLCELLHLDGVSASEYQQAAAWLLQPLGDAASAIACLEKALLHAEAAQQCDLLGQLAQAHQQAGNPAAGLQCLAQALANPTAEPETLADLRRAKAHLLIENNQPAEALAWIESILPIQAEDGHLHHLAASQYRARGAWALAWQHAEQSLHGAPPPGFHLLAAELARGLLRFEQASGILQQIAQPDAFSQTLQAELALQNQAEIEAATALTGAIEATPLEQIDQPALRGRLTCLQARLTLRRGDAAQAAELYQQARRALSVVNPLSSNAAYGLVAAALEMEDWPTALHQARQCAAGLAEPYADFLLAGVLLHRAETQRLYELTQAIQRAPGVAAIAPAERREFERALRKAREGVGQSAEGLQDDEKRGRAVFLNERTDRATQQPYQAVANWLDQMAAQPEETQAAIRASALPLPPAIRQYLLALAARHTGQAAEAQQAIGIALAHWPNEPRWQALAAEICLETQSYLQAVEHGEQAIQIEPQYAPHYLLLGQALLALCLPAGQPHPQRAELTRRALQALTQATRLDENLAAAWYALAHLQLHTEDLRQAAISAERAVNLAPDQPDYLLLRAQIALHTHQPTEALQHAQAALNLQPERHTALLLAARALQALERPAEALRLLEQSNASAPATLEPASAPSDSPKTLALQIERVRALAQTRGLPNALEAASALVETYPAQPQAWSTLAHLQAENGEREAAIRSAQKGLQHLKAAHQPGENGANLPAALHYLIGDLWRRAGQLDQAVHHLEQAIQCDPGHVEACLSLGQTQQERRQYGQALEAYQRAIATAPHDSRPYLQAGLALKDGKNYLAAETMLRRAAELAPKDVSIRRQLAAVVALNLVHNRREADHLNYAIE
jgi:tetratricopeptide (TPR) repeat protein